MFLGKKVPGHFLRKKDPVFFYQISKKMLTKRKNPSIILVA